MTVRFLNRVLFIFLFSTGCVRHATSQNFGLPMPQSVKPSPAGWNALGIMYDASGTLSAAETAFREAVVQNPQSEQWHNNLGYNLLLQNKAESAEAEFRTALQLNPQSATAHNNLATLLAR